MNESLSVSDAIATRRSIRAFLPDPVDRGTLEAIIEHACRAPSGSNIQPWKVYVLTGDVKAALSRAILDVFNDPDADREHEEEFAYYPRTWTSPFIERRRALGIGLYTLLGLTRDDKQGMHAQMARNFEFFGAPVGIIFTTDRTMERGSWLDYGMFLQNVMLMARAFGLDTCPQAAFNRYHRIIAAQLELPDNETVVCGMSLGFADASQPENQLRSAREPLHNVLRFLDSSVRHDAASQKRQK
ncbi:nitroreductase [Caballeronia sp. LZ062]|uniref:nitroreductase n=1 Tax=unclassified Caballeronia TaxID=2646786 RepID=UPI002865C378|nr:MULTISPECIES: nitroreductase [unclassified Caballeronia]MDR5856457.1 nitroreductase [Caballeronia sp. LZ050]MDR5873127.1 nitroreductase [Caballeronia sp. LZ062]